MNKEELNEIKKVLRAKEPPVDWVYSFYVSPESEVVWTSFRKFLSFDEDERFRYTDIMKKALQGTMGRELNPVSLSSQASSLLPLWNLDYENHELLDAFVEQVAAAYAHTDPYFATLFHITYDVPGRSSDRLKLEDGDVVYQTLLFAICPATLTKPALGWDEDSGVYELDRRWTIGAPVEGFLYPAFSDRVSDLNETLYRAKKGISPDLFDALFDAGIPATQKEQKEAFHILMDALGVSVSSASALQEDLSHLEAEDVTNLEKNDVKKLAERCGVNTDDFDDSYEDCVGDMVLTVPALREPAVIVSTDSATIKVDTDRSSLISTRSIDGVTYLCIPVDGGVLVNGIPALAAPEEKE